MCAGGPNEPRTRPPFRASVTGVRVPVYRSHSIAVSAEFDRSVTVEAGHAFHSRRRFRLPAPERGSKVEPVKQPHFR